MSNIDTVYEFIASQSPRRVTNRDIGNGTGIRPHQQVFQLTQKLLEAKRIRGVHFEKEWLFWVDKKNHSAERLQVEEIAQVSSPEPPERETGPTPAEFETFAAQVMGRHFGTELRKGQMPGIHKTFDFVSTDGTIVGDAKFFTMVRGSGLPPAKFSIIAEHVWLLEHCEASRKFLAFGNDRRVPEEWLSRHGALATQIEFYFLDSDGTLHTLQTAESEETDDQSVKPEGFGQKIKEFLVNLLPGRS